MAGGDGKIRLSPPMIWAQRMDKVYLTINLEDVENPEIKLEEKQLYFKGKGGTEKKEFEVTVEFYAAVNPDDSRYGVLPRNIPMVIKKKEGSFWPRLLNEKGKKHWLKTDFDKWKDEDDSDQDEKQDFQLEDMMQQMGNFNAGNPAGGGMGMDEDDEDSDDEELPDLEDNTDKKTEEESKSQATKIEEDQKS